MGIPYGCRHRTLEHESRQRRHLGRIIIVRRPLSADSRQRKNQVSQFRFRRDSPAFAQEQAGFRLYGTQQIHNDGRIRASHSKVNDGDILRRSHPHVRPITGLRKLKLFTEYIYVIIEIGQQNILPEVGQGMLCIAWQPIFHDFRFRFHCFCVFLFPLYPAKDRGVFLAKLANDYVKPSTISHKSDKAGRPDGRLR
jgi:hypothetical protein